MSNTTEVDTSDIVSFMNEAVASLGEKRAALAAATEAADSVKAIGDDRIRKVQQEIATEHDEALDAEAEARESYNAALDDALGKKILTAEVLKGMGFERIAGRRGRPRRRAAED